MFDVSREKCDIKCGFFLFLFFSALLCIFDCPPLRYSLLITRQPKWNGYYSMYKDKFGSFASICP